MTKLPGVAEILKGVNEKATEQERQDVLAGHWPNVTMLKVLRGFWADDQILDLPAGTPPYTPAKKSQDLQGSLYREIKKMYIFLPETNAKRTRKEQLFIEMLEVLDPDDAELIVAMKDRKMPYENITEDLVRKTFPDLLPPRPFQAEDEAEVTETKRVGTISIPHSAKPPKANSTNQARVAAWYTRQAEIEANRK